MIISALIGAEPNNLHCVAGHIQMVTDRVGVVERACQFYGKYSHLLDI